MESLQVDVDALAATIAAHMERQYRGVSYAALHNSIASTLNEWGVGSVKLHIFRDKPRYLTYVRGVDMPDTHDVLRALNDLNADEPFIEPVTAVQKALATFDRLIAADIEAERLRDESG